MPVAACSLVVTLLIAVMGYTMCYAHTMWQRHDSKLIRFLGFSVNNKIMAYMNSIIYHVGVVKDVMNGEAQKRLRLQQKDPPVSGGYMFSIRHGVI